jgi:hypothetical protein
MEGKVVSSAITRLAKKDALDPRFIGALRYAFEIFEGPIDGLGFCLSEDGDLLSQWRGYAADATGVSIGFSTAYLTWLSERNAAKGSGFTLQKVEYQPHEHELAVYPSYQAIKKLVDNGALRTSLLHKYLDPHTRSEVDEGKDDELQLTAVNMLGELLPLIAHLFRLKAYAFREEREWRAISFYVREVGASCLYRPVLNRIIPYKKIELEGLERDSIKEVILGPKHETPINVVQDLLRQNSFGNVVVRRSEASYR